MLLVKILGPEQGGTNNQGFLCDRFDLNRRSAVVAYRSGINGNR
jgi:hypothetical protein